MGQRLRGLCCHRVGEGLRGQPLPHTEPIARGKQQGHLRELQGKKAPGKGPACSFFSCFLRKLSPGLACLAPSAFTRPQAYPTTCCLAALPHPGRRTWCCVAQPPTAVPSCRGTKPQTPGQSGRLRARLRPRLLRDFYSASSPPGPAPAELSAGLLWRPLNAAWDGREAARGDVTRRRTAMTCCAGAAAGPVGPRVGRSAGPDMAARAGPQEDE